MGRRLSAVLAFVVLAATACAPSRGNDWATDASGDGGPSDAGQDSARPCTTGDLYCSGDLRQVLACDPATGEERVVTPCGEGTACIGGACQAVLCIPGESSCADATTQQVCRLDGSGWDTTVCPEGRRCSAENGACEIPCALRVFILLDSSGSMGGEERPTKWEQAREALAELMSSASAANVEFGLGVFPSGGGDCDTSEQLVYPVPTATASLIDEYFVSHGPSGDTPLYDAMTLLLSDTTNGLGDPAYQDFVLLVSDGSDTCYDEDCLSECGLFNPICLINCENRAEEEVIVELGVSTRRLVEERQTRTFVIGFGSGVSDEELSAIADNGATVLGRWLPASNVEELTAAFGDILAEMLECNPIY